MKIILSPRIELHAVGFKALCFECKGSRSWVLRSMVEDLDLEFRPCRVEKSAV